MKIYTNAFDLKTPVSRQFKAGPYSDFGIGIKITNGGEAVEDEFTLVADGAELTPETDKVGGFTVYAVTSDAPGSTKYTITCRGQTFSLTQVVADSGVLEKKTSDITTEYVVIIGNIDDEGALSRSHLSDVVEVEDHALQGAFAGNEDLTNVGFPNMTTIGEYGMANAFNNCSALATVDMSKLSAVDTNGLSGTFDGCTSLQIVLFQNSAAVPAITDTTFANTNDTYTVIVPDSLYETWIAETNWSDISAHIAKVSDYLAVMTNYGGQDNMDD